MKISPEKSSTFFLAGGSKKERKRERERERERVAAESASSSFCFCFLLLAGRAAMRVKRVKVALTTEVLLPEYAHHLKGENYVVSIDLDEERGRGRGRGQPKQLVWVWNKVKEGYGHVMQKKWRESFVLTLSGGVRLNPSNGVNEGDTIEVCKPLPWEDELWRNQSNQIAANAAATSTDVERVGSDENGGGGHLSLPVTPTEQRVEVTRPSRSSIRKAKKSKFWPFTKPFFVLSR